MPTHDPEGLYGSIAGTASVLFGYLAGRILIDNAQLRDRIFFMIAVGVVLLIAGGVWSRFDIICKNLWTTPYTLINAGVDFIWLAIFMKIFDAGFKMTKIYELMIAFGRNPLFFFFANSVIVLFLFIMPTLTFGFIGTRRRELSRPNLARRSFVRCGLCFGCLSPKFSTGLIS